MKCAAHPEVETVLRCGRCGKPICPRCMVETPVGAKCRECARPAKLPTYRVSASHYLRAALVALGMAVACGIAWILIGPSMPFFFRLFIAPAIGYAIGEVVSRAVNRKRGTGLAVIAGLAVVLAFLVYLLFPLGIFWFGTLNLLQLGAVAVGVYFAVSRLR